MRKYSCLFWTILSGWLSDISNWWWINRSSTSSSKLLYCSSLKWHWYQADDRYQWKLSGLFLDQTLIYIRWNRKIMRNHKEISIITEQVKFWIEEWYNELMQTELWQWLTKLLSNVKLTEEEWNKNFILKN